MSWPSAPAARASLEAWERRTASALPAADKVPATYRVRPGDSLSSIASRLYNDRAVWPVLYWRNHKRIHWADDIYAGEVLRVPARPAHIPKAPAALQQPGPAISATGLNPAPAQAVGQSSGMTDAAYAGGTPGGAFGACVIARESGGDAQVMNATGHYGLYQFSESTWAAYGGDPADFGHASVAEQNQVFANALAAGGQSNWAPYDGC
jgi:LysM repeat protein